MYELDEDHLSGLITIKYDLYLPKIHMDGLERIYDSPYDRQFYDVI